MEREARRAKEAIERELRRKAEEERRRREALRRAAEEAARKAAKALKELPTADKIAR